MKSAFRKRFVGVALLVLTTLILVGIWLEIYLDRDWVGSPEGNTTPIWIPRNFFGHPFAFDKVVREYGINSTWVTLEGKWRLPGSGGYPQQVTFLSTDTGVWSEDGWKPFNPKSPLNISLCTPRSAPTLHWLLFLSPDGKPSPEIAVKFSTPNPGRIQKSNGNEVTNPTQTAAPLQVTMSDVSTTKEDEDTGPPPPRLVYNNWQSVKRWLSYWVRPPRLPEAPAPSASGATLSWSPQEDWMPLADRVIPNFGPAFSGQDWFADTGLGFSSVLWLEDGPYGVHLVFGHFHELAGPANLRTPLSGEMIPLHQSYTWGKSSLELVSLRSGDPNSNRPSQLVMRMRAAGLFIKVKVGIGSGRSYLEPVDQPVSPGDESVNITPGGYPFIALTQQVENLPTYSRNPDQKPCFKVSLLDQPVEVTCNFEPTSGDLVTFNFVLIDEVRVVHFGVMPKLVPGSRMRL